MSRSTLRKLRKVSAGRRWPIRAILQSYRESPCRFVFAALLILAAAPAFCQNWNPRLAEQYMDSRLKEWAAWPNAQVSGVVCVSCHSGLPYLVSRPALRQSLDEKSGPTLYEDLLVEGTRATVFRTDAKELFGGLKGRLIDQVYAAVSVVSAVVIAMEDAPRGKLSPEGEKAFERMWSIQVKDGPDQGAWQWSDYNLDPWETKDSVAYGAALAALATGLAPADYQSRPEVQENIAALKAYLREGQKSNTHYTTGCSCCGRPRSCATCCRRAISRRFSRSCSANRKPTAAGRSRRWVRGRSTTRRRHRLVPTAI